MEVFPPVASQPADVLLDGFDELNLLGGGVRVVEAEVGVAAVAGREAEVERDRLGVPDVEEAVRLGREGVTTPPRTRPPPGRRR